MKISIKYESTNENKLPVSMTRYAKSSLNSLNDTENFTDLAIEHIFEGQVNKKGLAVGYHYDEIEGTVGKIISGTKQSANELGIYSAKVEINGMPKLANEGKSTFFPSNMCPQDVIDCINEAYKNRKHEQSNLYIGDAQNGMQIGIFLNSQNEIISAFPIMDE